ncbi:cobalt ECF transporter T component CbiQ [Anabaena sp. FACHB-709]|uniref:Cobalt transport protein CbiQ n=2 Tax=Nostocaceae TaxID=1162 RepID=A0A1Z4KKT0_ANAVA|nr:MULTISPECIES: cobalt ECF transporter T component CbiQ [Nostocaceae]BAY69572.1 cobalt transport protein CbiQ [Trichormus variabilis NIES-23]HBW31754.1 cobalt ECF transporter T component CbiQ [Nostoc sp. UBA8866]MBD2170963.1 cobalt ECF transporter T component CbiQ [Anabaena cylindrica FACHB-318]MBD2262745.1 cobalt ECF transporter T component CbiQ [Anabaena sp. FACHB-709]MBD2272458.1 cobalt ECF transporter T component CbiQ [Nostoc sp. PCC 7120 = FACHB-418]
MTLQIDTLAYTNKLRRLAPGQKLLLAIALLMITAFAHPLVQILIALWMSIWTIFYAGIPAKIYLKLIYIAGFFWLTSLPALAINGVGISQLNLVQNDAVYGVNIGFYYLYISQHGLEQVWQIFTRAIASISCLYFVMLTIPFTDLLQTLRRYGFPILLTDLLLLMYRFIFVLLKTASDLWTAQQARNGYATFSLSMKSLSLLISQLFQRTLEKYQQISLSLVSRGFNGEFQVWHPCRYHLSKRYATEAILGCFLLIILEWNLHLIK